MIHPSVFTIIAFSLVLEFFFFFCTFLSLLSLFFFFILLLISVEVDAASQTSNEKFLCKDIILVC